ncbi:MAG: MBOAT family protein [Anaerolineae bacterium]|nr:MBOAT family protein [Anaerolineae bacterium]
MIFNSFEYVIFLALVALVHGRLRSARAQNALLVAASYFFYARWDWRFVWVLALSTLVNYIVGQRMDSAPDTNRRRWLVLGISANLLALGFFKYFNFFVDSLADLLTTLGIPASHSTLQILIPLGISFYSLQQITYLLSVYRRELPASRSLINFALFSAFFPQLAAGPIERATNMMPQIEQRRSPTPEQVESGLVLILLGIFKKIVIADVAASLMNNRIFLSAAEYSSGEILAVVYLFAVQIYADFSAYSDIARGSGKLVGIDLMENFRQPYFAQTVSEFWQRWHISLSSWLRDYVFLPMSRSLLKRWGTRWSNLIVIIANLTTMIISGLWHGANWTFIAWGALLGMYVIVSRQFQGKARPLLKHPSAIVRNVFIGLRILLTFHLILLAWVVFRADTIQQVGPIYGRLANVVMGGDWGKHTPSTFAAIILLYLITIALDLAQSVTQEHAFPIKLPAPARTMLYLAAVLGILFFSIKPYVPFIYFQF